MKLAVCLLAAAACVAQAQGLKFPPSLDKLADKAEEVVDVTLDPATLGLASKFLGNHSPEEAKAKKVVEGLKGIYVRSYKFAKEGEYSEADVEAVRAQMKGPGWNCIVKVRSHKDKKNADVCFITQDGKITGLGVVSAEPKELTLVSISGFIDPEQLQMLEGQFGIPKGNYKVEIEKKKHADKDKEDKPE